MMTNGDARCLRFSCDDIGEDVNLMLVFAPPLGAGELYVNLFPICWKFIKLQGVGHASASVTYTAKTAFFTPQVDVENTVTAANFEPCSTGQECTIITGEGGEHVVSAAVTYDKGFLTCENKVTSEKSVNIGVGLVDKTGNNIESILLRKKVGVHCKVSVKFTPTLNIYACGDYQATKIITAEVEAPVLWTGDLEDLEPSTQLVLTINDSTGMLEINTT